MERSQKIMRCSIIGIFVNAALALTKILIGVAAGSVSITNDGINNLTDGLSSLLTLIGTKLAIRKPDRKHPYGYGRIEYLSALGVAFITGYVGFSTLRSAILSLLDDKIAHYDMLGLGILALAVLVKIGLGFFTLRKGKETESQALITSGTDSFSDGLVSAFALVGAAVNRFTGIEIEGWLAILISLFVIKSGGHLLVKSFNNLIGERENAGLVRQIRDDVIQYSEVLGVYDIILNDYGHGEMIGSLHIEVDDDTTAVVIHRLTHRITHQIYEKYAVILTVGIYASNTSDPAAAAVFDRILDLQKRYDGIRQVHGFYMDREQSAISFDLVFDFSANPAEVCSGIKRDLAALYPGYTVDIVCDTDFG